MYLDGCLPELYELLRQPLTNEQLERHPLIRMLATHGSGGERLRRDRYQGELTPDQPDGPLK